MTKIVERITGNQRLDSKEVEAYLEAEGIYYEKWSSDKTPEFVNKQIAFSEEEKQQLLTLYDSEINDFARRKGYTNWDIAVLSTETPEMLAKFGALHVHKEDEVRIVVGGEGIFIIKSQRENGYFELHASIGDVVIVPQERYHAFKLGGEPKFAVVRLFTGEAGSITYPVEDLSFYVK